MRTQLLGVVTVTYNSGAFLPEFVDSCSAQTHGAFNVYCIDNKSSDNTLSVLRESRDQRWRITINEENRGVAAGNNQGIMQALKDGCEWILLLNNDTRFDETFFETLITTSIAHGWLVAVPKIYYDRPAGSIWYGGGGFNRWKGFTGFHKEMGIQDVGQCDAPCTVQYAPTCAMLVHRDIFRQVGLMDETYFVYFDDTDFCWRLRIAGVSLGYCPDATIVHKVGGSTGGGKSAFSGFYISRNRMYFLRKHFGRVAAWVWAPVFISVYLVRYLTRWCDYSCLAASVKGTFSCGDMKPRVPMIPKSE
jgi:hypothetical protein